MKDLTNDYLIVNELLKAFDTKFHVVLKDADTKETPYIGVLKNYPRLNEIMNLEITQLYPAAPVGSTTPTLTILIRGLVKPIEDNYDPFEDDIEVEE